MTKSSPGFTHATMGMSGCQRLWIISFLYGDFDRSIFDQSLRHSFVLLPHTLFEALAHTSKPARPLNADSS